MQRERENSRRLRQVGTATNSFAKAQEIIQAEKHESELIMVLSSHKMQET